MNKKELKFFGGADKIMGIRYSKFRPIFDYHLYP